MSEEKQHTLTPSDTDGARASARPGGFRLTPVGVLAVLGTIVLLLVLVNAISRIGKTSARSREALIDEMRDAIDEGYAAADQLQQFPDQIRSAPQGLDCDAVPAIPAVYTIGESNRADYPDLTEAVDAVNAARRVLHDAEARWRHLCKDNDDRLTQTPDHILAITEAMLVAGRQALDDAAQLLDELETPAAPAQP
jgi:hypothetical protein